MFKNTILVIIECFQTVYFGKTKQEFKDSVIK